MAMIRRQLGGRGFAVGARVAGKHRPANRAWDRFGPSGGDLLFAAMQEPAHTYAVTGPVHAVPRELPR